MAEDVYYQTAQELRFRALLRRIKFPKHQLHLLLSNSHYFLYVSLRGTEWKGRKWRLSTHMLDEEVVQTAFKAIMTFVEHETREQFLFDGLPIYGPHLSLEALKQAAKNPVSRAKEHE